MKKPMATKPGDPDHSDWDEDTEAGMFVAALAFLLSSVFIVCLVLYHANK